MITAPQIMRATARACGMTVEEMLQDNRRRAYAYPRFAAMILARQMTGSSLHRLAGLFHRDHSVICHAMRMNKPEVDEIVERVRAELDPR